MSLPRRALALVCSMLLTAACTAADDYPNRPIAVIVPFPAGGAIDVVTRVLLENMADGLGQPMVTLNKPGASGNVGTAQAVRANADGYTLLLGGAANTAVSPYMYSDLGYDVARDLAPIAKFADAVNVIYVGATFPVHSLAELMDVLRREPEKYAYASPGSGTTAHLTMELIRERHDAKVLHVPFRGSPAAVTAVASGQVPIGVDAIGPVLPLLQAGKLRALAVSGKTRYAALPDVPTFREAGIDIPVPASYLGLFAPAGVPSNVLARLAEAVRNAVGDAQVASRMRDLGYTPGYLERDGFADRVTRERPMWGDAVKVSGATVDG